MFTQGNRTVILGDLYEFLLRFRANKNGIIADIEKAFSQVEFHLVDRDVTRFYGSNTLTNQ